GAWLERNGAAIRGTRPWVRAASTTGCGVPVRFTHDADALYALLLDTPKADEVRLRDVPVADAAAIHLLGDDLPLTWRRQDDDVVVRLPAPLERQAAYALRIAEEG